jgi:hypothetical protein
MKTSINTRCAVAVLAACSAFAVRAEFYTGNDLLRLMNSESSGERGIALGYVMGITDFGMNVIHCPPSDVTAGQVRDMMRNYLTANPQERHNTGDTLILRVLKQAWPCAQRGNNNNRGGTSL